MCNGDKLNRYSLVIPVAHEVIFHSLIKRCHYYLAHQIPHHSLEYPCVNKMTLPKGNADVNDPVGQNIRDYTFKIMILKYMFGNQLDRVRQALIN